MSFLDRLAEMAKSAATTDLQLQQLRRDLDRIGESVDDLVQTVQDHAMRITRLEAQRDADRSQFDALRAQLEAECRASEATLAQFRLEVERAELRLHRPLPPGEMP